MVKVKDKPVLLGFILCDQVIKDEETKSPSLIGMFDTISAPNFPATHRKLVVFTFWLWKRENKDFPQTVKILDPEGLEIASLSVAARFNETADRAYSTFTFNNIPLKKPGVYKIQLWFEGEIFTEVPFRVESK